MFFYKTAGSPSKYKTSNSVRNASKTPNPNNPELWSGLSEADALDAFLHSPPPMPAFMPPRGPRLPVRQPYNNRNLYNSTPAAINNPVPQHPRMFNNGPRTRSSSGFEQSCFTITQQPFHDQQTRFPPPPVPQRPPLFSEIESCEVDLDIQTKLSKKRRLVNPVVSSQNVMKSPETAVEKSWGKLALNN